MPVKLPGSRQRVAAGFIYGMLTGYRHKGLDPVHLVRDAGLEETFLFDSHQRVTLEQCVRIYELIVQELDDEGFGLFKRPLRQGSWELFFRGLSSSMTLREAITRACTYLRVLVPEFALSFDVSGERAMLIIDEVEPLAKDLPMAGRVFAYEWVLRHLHGFFCWLVGRGISLDEVNFPYEAPVHMLDYRMLFTEDARFGARRLQACFRSNLLELPVRRDESALQEFLKGGPSKLTSLFRREREIVIRVRNLLKTDMSSQPSLESVAQALFISPRTLHRRLQEEGSSLSAIRNALRRDMALSVMDRGGLPTAEMARQLGYADNSSFYRAFIGWTGMSPSAYLKRATE